MGVVGSLPSSLPLTKNSDIQNEHPLPLSNESSNETMSIIPDIINNNHQKPYETLSSDHLCVKNYQLMASRLETGRCLKHRRLESKKIMKRKLRCKKYRRTTRILNTKDKNIREQLNKQVRQLELKQNHLLSTVEKLYLYKHQLEVICEQVNSNHQPIG